MKRISSRDNPGFKRLKALAHSGRERRKENRTLLDGAHLVAAYLDRVGRPELLVAGEGGLDDPEIAVLLRRAQDTPVLLLADSLFAEASPVDTPTGLLALIETPRQPFSESITGNCVLLDRVQDAGNLGSILRSAAAAGVRDILLTDGCAQAWSPKVLRAGMGAHFGLRILEHANLALLQRHPGRIVATVADAAQSLYELDLCDPVAWLFGSEGGGLSPETAALAGARVRIPMAPGSESLNVAACAAVCLFEQLRQGSSAGR